MDAQCYLDLLVIWAYDRGYSVFFERNGDDSICDNSKIISIKNTVTKESQLFTLLHECGHLLIYKNGDVFNLNDIRASYSEGSQIYKTYRVIEEIEAWKRGRQLAKRLNISIDQDRWDRAISRAITKYIKWSVSVGGY